MKFLLYKNSDGYFHALVSLLAVVVLTAGLHACGFQLRGSITLSADISPLYLEHNSAFDLAREIKSLLATNNIKVTDRESQSRSRLILLNDEKSRRVLSVDGSGRVREYLLTYRVNFVVKTDQLQIPETSQIAAGSDGHKDNVAQDSVSVTRTLLFDADAVLAVTNEAEIIYKDMRREAARLILLKLQAKSNNASSGVRDKLVSDPDINKSDAL